MLFALYVITILFILYGLLIPTSRIVMGIQVFWLWIIMGWNTDGMDYPGNHLIFMSASRESFDFRKYGWAYELLACIFKDNGLFYECLQAFIVALSLGVLYYLAVKMSKFPAFLISLFYIYPFLDSAIQRRFFPCMMLCALAIFVMLKHHKYWFIKYAFLMYFAYGFHVVSIFFFPVFLIYYISKSRLLWFVGISVLAIFLLLGVMPTILSYFIGNEKASFYTSVFGVELWKGIVFMIQQLLFVFLVALLYKQKTGYSLVSPRINISFQENIMKLNYYTCLILPFYCFDNVFIRFFRVVFIFDYALCLSKMQTPFKGRRQSFLFFGTYCMYLFIYAVMIYLVLGNSGFDIIVKPFFENNLIFNFMGV